VNPALPNRVRRKSPSANVKTEHSRAQTQGEEMYLVINDYLSLLIGGLAAGMTVAGCDEMTSMFFVRLV
jgi:hypothetical protein